MAGGRSIGSSAGPLDSAIGDCHGAPEGAAGAGGCAIHGSATGAPGAGCAIHGSATGACCCGIGAGGAGGGGACGTGAYQYCAEAPAERARALTASKA